MPIYLRKFYLKTLIEHKEKERRDIEKSQSKLSKSKSRPTVKPKFKR